MSTPYDAEYYLRGKENGISNYSDYKWLGQPTIVLARSIAEVMGIQPKETFLDYGCARGYVVKAMRLIGVEAFGLDISNWAIKNCDPDVKDYVGQQPPIDQWWDYALAKDIMEHLEVIELMKLTGFLLSRVNKSILIVVPLSEKVGGQYVRREDDMDVTHVIRWPLEEWMHFFNNRIPNHEWTLTGSWHLPGLKPASQTHPKSCGFIQLRRHLTA